MTRHGASVGDTDGQRNDIPRLSGAGGARELLGSDLIQTFGRLSTDGHAVGDLAIRHVTTLASQELRGYDHKFRIGGEEFLVCIPGGLGTPGVEVAERLRRRIEVSPLDVAVGGHAVPLTVSIGCASQDAASPGWEFVLQRADEALYRAKQGGRNRVESHGGGPLATTG